MPVLAQDAFTSALSEIWAEVREAEAIGGRARLPCTDEYSALSTERLYPLRDTTYAVELATRPDVGGGTTQAILEATVDHENKFILYLENDVLNFEEIAGGASTETNVLYEPTAHRWWRIRIEGTTVFWETSPDGSTWTTRRTKEAAVDVDQIAEGRLLSGFYGKESGLSPAYAEFDNFSIDGPLFKPEATTGAVDPALARSTRLHGTVDPNLSPAAYHFEFGETTEYGRQAPLGEDAEVGAGADAVEVSQFISGLKPNTTYHYRLVATSEGGTDHGEDLKFKTSPGISVGGRIIDPIVRANVFTGAKRSDFSRIEEAPGAITEVPDPGGSGDTVFKMTVNDKDVFPITPTENPRAQAFSFDEIEPGGVYWLKGGFYLPADFPDSMPAVGEDSGFLSLIAFYGPPYDNSGPWEISIGGDPVAKIIWQRNDSYGYDIPWEMPLVKEQWVDVVAHFKFAIDGWMEFWINGEKITFFEPGASYDPSEHGPADRLEMQTRDHSNNGANNQAKISNYRLAGMFESLTVYHRPLVLDRVAPAAVRFTDRKISHSRIAVSREFPPDRLAVRIADPITGQSIARWAEDEHKAQNVLSGLTKSGEMPGGHKDSGGGLPRDPRINWPDTDTYLDYFIEGAGREDVWNGRINLRSDSDGDRMATEPKAVGHQAALEDRTALRMGFIDGDLSKWGDPSTQRKHEIDGFYETRSVEISTGWQDKGEEPPSITIRISFEDGHPLGEQWYSGDGVRLGALGYDFKNISGVLAGTNDIARLNATDVAGWTASGTNHGTTSASQQWLTTTNPNIKYAVLQTFYEGLYAEAGTDSKAWSNLRVLSFIAAQNLALQGTWPNVGYTAKQMLEVAVPEFSYLEVDPEDIEDDGFVIPQAWYSDPGMLADVVKDLTKYGLYYWFVMNGKRFELRRPGTFGREWQAYAGPSEFKETGEDGSRLWDRLVVAYQDVSGRTITIGWPGSGADYETEALQITDPDHPAVKAGVVREDLLTLKGISDFNPALGAGERWLAEANELSHAGEAVLRGYIQDSATVFRPVSQVQPGDRLRFPDAGSSGTGYREIVAVSYDHDSRTAAVNLDAPPDAIEALLERYGATLSSLQLS